MKPGPKMRVEELFHAALERDPTQREAFLVEACAGDAALLAEVRSLLGRARNAEAAGTWTGLRIRDYEVLSPLGAGGMGEVYRARDTKLGREVALKVLPEAFARDPERVQRFEREARLLAALNHPHVAAIYGVEEHEGRHVLVLELVEGETLAERIAGGPMPVEDALPLFEHIAQGLDAAHEKGIVHRDLKPANIKIAPDGNVKILDLGLAKAVVGQTTGPDPSEAPTVPADRTRDGVLMGTPAYMSPEQARGRNVDRRTDVWAFGCVLYEVLTGRPVFASDSVSDTLAAVLTKDPDWNALPTTTPEAIRRLLRRCLAKDPARRLREAGSAIVEIQEARNEPTPSDAARDTGPHVGPRLVSAAMLALALVVSAAAVGWMWLRRRPEPVAVTSRFAFTLPSSQVMPNRMGDALALSPDGRTLVYRAARAASLSYELFRRPVDEFAETPIDGTEGGVSPFFSPDGQWVGFVRASELVKVPLAGGTVHHLTDLPNPNIRGADWGRDDVIVFGWKQLMQVPAAGGAATPIFTPNDERSAWYPQILPDGDSVLFTLSRGGPDSGEIDVLNRRTGEHHVVLANGSKGRLLPTGHLVFVQSGRLWGVPCDAERLEATGAPVPVVESVRVENGGAVQFATAEQGTLVYLPASSAGSRSKNIVWVDRTGQEQAVTLPARNYQGLSLAPDGTRAAFQVDEGVAADVWVSDLERGTLSPITTDRGFDGGPLWSPDGERIVYLSDRNGQRHLMIESSDGTGSAEVLATFDADALDARPLAWTPDGTTLLTWSQTATTNGDIGTVLVHGSDGWKPLIQTPTNEMTPAISPDGRWLAYSSFDTGRFQVYVQRFPALGDRQQVSVSTGWGPTWTSSGKEIIFLDTNVRDSAPDAVMRVSVEPVAVDASSLRFGAPERLFDFDISRYYAMPNIRFYDVSPDGRRLLTMAFADEPDSTRAEIHVVLNWFRELEQLVPAE
jgi:serine/threonine protein kinase/Tol biopolymer transport system component